MRTETDGSYLLSLLADYEAARSDDRAWAQLLGGLFAALVALLGILAAALPSLEDGYLLAALPVAPAAVLAFAVFVGIPGTIRSYYMRAIEAEIRRVARARHAKAPTGDLVSTLAWTSLLMEAASMRRGHPLYRAIAAVIFACVIVAYGGLVLVIFLRVDDGLQALMALFYSAVTLILIAAALEATVRGDKLFSRTAQSLRDGRAASARDDGRFLKYLIYPRPADVIKWTFVPISALVLVGLSPEAAFGMHEVGVVVLTAVVFEGLLYAARYQVNDIRDYDRDVQHPSSDYRGRLPRGRDNPQRRAIVLTSLAIACYRVALAGALVGILAPELLRWNGWVPDVGPIEAMGFVIAALLVATTIAYEWARARSRAVGGAIWDGARERISPARFATREAWAVWLVVGAGYALRGVVAWQAAELVGASPSTLAIVSALVFLFGLGVMSVTQTWALEATAHFVASHPRPAILHTAREKPHLVALPAFLSKRFGFDSFDRASNEIEEQAARDRMTTMRAEAVLTPRSRLFAPWHLAYGVTAAAALLILSEPTHPRWVIVSAIAVGVAATIATYWANSARTRLGTALALSVVLLGISVVSSVPFWVSAASVVPLLTLLLVDAGFRTSSHESLVSSTEKVGETALALGAAAFAALTGETGRRLWPPRGDKTVSEPE